MSVPWSDADWGRWRGRQASRARAKLRDYAGMLKFLGIHTVQVEVEGYVGDGGMSDAVYGPDSSAWVPDGTTDAIREAFGYGLLPHRDDHRKGVDANGVLRLDCLSGMASYTREDGAVVHFQPSRPVRKVGLAPLSTGVSALLDKTVGPGGCPGVLADWLDEQSIHWTGLTTYLRLASSTRPDTTEDRAYYTPPCYLIIADDVLIWLVRRGQFINPGQWSPELRVGFYRTTPSREASFQLTVARSAIAKADEKSLWALFGLPMPAP